MEGQIGVNQANKEGKSVPGRRNSKVDGPGAGGSLVSMRDKCREQEKGAGDIGRPGCTGPGSLWEDSGLYVESSVESWKGLSPQVM